MLEVELLSQEDPNILTLVTAAKLTMTGVVAIYISSGNVCESLFSRPFANKVLFKLLDTISAGECWIFLLGVSFSLAFCLLCGRFAGSSVPFRSMLEANLNLGVFLLLVGVILFLGTLRAIWFSLKSNVQEPRGLLHSR